MSIKLAFKSRRLKLIVHKMQIFERIKSKADILES